MKLISGILFLLLASFQVSANSLADQLKADGRINPLGFDNPVPELSWIILSEERGTAQQAYEILIGKNNQNSIPIQTSGTEV